MNIKTNQSDYNPAFAVAQSMQQIKQNIRIAEQQAQLPRGGVLLLAVSKQQSLAKIQAAIDQGQQDFAENTVQEALRKMSQLPSDLIWHYIGNIQSNKTKLIAQHFAWVHSITRPSIAIRLNNARSETQAPLNVLVEVNIDQDPSKAGVSPEMIIPLAEQILSLPRLKLRGLMAITQQQATQKQLTASYRRVARLQQNLIAQGHPLDTLSMGMSRDYQLAIKAGSNLVRLGQALFGPRE